MYNIHVQYAIYNAQYAQYTKYENRPCHQDVSSSYLGDNAAC